MKTPMFQVCFYMGDTLSIVFEDQLLKDKAMVACKNMCTAYVSDYQEIPDGFRPNVKLDERKWVVEEVPAEYYDILGRLNEKMKRLDDLLNNDKIRLEDYKRDAREAHLTLVNMADSKGQKWTKQPGFDVIRQRCWSLGY